MDVEEKFPAISLKMFKLMDMASTMELELKYEIRNTI